MTLRNVISRLTFGFVQATEVSRQDKALSKLRKTFDKVKGYENVELDPKFVLHLPVDVHMETLSLEDESDRENPSSGEEATCGQRTTKTVNDKDEKPASSNLTEAKRPVQQQEKTILPAATQDGKPKQDRRMEKAPAAARSKDGNESPKPPGDYFVPLPGQWISDQKLDYPPGPLINSKTDLRTEHAKTRNPLAKTALCSVMWYIEALKKTGTGKGDGVYDVIEASFDEDFQKHLCRDQDPECGICWITTDNRKDKPHTKIGVYNTARGLSAQLMRSELLTILALYCTRLIDKDYDNNHPVLPCMLFSVMAPLHARIIIAELDCRTRKLTIRMSQLLPAAPEDTESWAKFRRYIASNMTTPAL
ncbi:uncharacterized protein BDV17DRAFT_198971 [Aspergillus undulatus]|uniref:uncharacterized protein n=1 Tax=Aspergillus undulatus TaxID=1810928 RepID=UPI003CCD9CA3